MKLTNLLLAVATLTVFAFSAAAGDEIRLSAQLSGWGKGKAVYKTKADDRSVQGELQIEAENLAKDTNYIVFIGKDSVWQTRTNAFGRFEVRERYRNPKLEIGAGTPVVVNDKSGNTVLSGTFSRI